MNTDVSQAPNQHIRMISEGSCDTEDCSNAMATKKISFSITRINYILKYIKVVTVILTVIWNCNIISQYHCFYCISDQINAALVSIRDFFC